MHRLRLVRCSVPAACAFVGSSGFSRVGTQAGTTGRCSHLHRLRPVRSALPVWCDTHGSQRSHHVHQSFVDSHGRCFPNEVHPRVARCGAMRSPLIAAASRNSLQVAAHSERYSCLVCFHTRSARSQAAFAAGSASSQFSRLVWRSDSQRCCRSVRAAFQSPRPSMTL